MPNLYPEDDISLDAEEIAAAQVSFKGSAYFDFEKGDFVRQSGNKIRAATGAEAWEQWCIKALLTMRNGYLNYSDAYGSEIIAAIQADDRGETESILERTINETLLVDGRTDHIQDYTVEWQTPDAVKVYVTVVGIDGSTFTIDQNFSFGGE